MSTKYIIHKAVNFKDVLAATRKTLGANSVSDLAGTHAMQRKYDGVSGVLIVKPNGTQMLTRVGTEIVSCSHIQHKSQQLFRKRLEKGQAFVLLGELWQRGTKQATINGNVMRHDPSPTVQMVVFDMVTLDEFEAGHSERGFMDRYITAWNFIRGEAEDAPIRMCELYNPGTYGDPLVLAQHWVEMGGYDGGILRDPDGTWTAGGGTTGEIIKVKDAATISLDLRVVGMEPGRGKYKDTLGSLLVEYKGKTVKVSGMSDIQRDVWWLNPGIIEGQIVEVHALGESSTGLLREPRFKCIRHDKEEADA